jgi:anti-sigma regulatory factor (Ser/Thr protein kinase)
VKILKVEAKTEKLKEVLAFLDEELEALDCDIKTVFALDLSVEEIFVNIASYAYGEGEGEAEISLDFSEEDNMLTITFRDSGLPYDPLAKEDPDVTLSLEERKIGGLGIFMVKKNVDEMDYEYKDGQNILYLRKKIR